MPLEMKLTPKQREIMLDRPQDCIYEVWFDMVSCWMTNEEKTSLGLIASERFTEAYEIAYRQVKAGKLMVCADMPLYQMVDYILSDMITGSTWGRCGDREAGQLEKLRELAIDSGLLVRDWI